MKVLPNSPHEGVVSKSSGKGTPPYTRPRDQRLYDHLTCPEGFRRQDWERMSWHHRTRVLARINRENRPADEDLDAMPEPNRRKKPKKVPELVKVTNPVAKVDAIQTLIAQLDALLTEDHYRATRGRVVRYTIRRHGDAWTITGLGPDGSERVTLSRDTWADAVATFSRIAASVKRAA